VFQQARFLPCVVAETCRGRIGVASIYLRLCTDVGITPLPLDPLFKAAGPQALQIMT